MNNSILKHKEIEALHHIRNFIVHYGRMPSVRELMKALGYRSPRSALVVMRQLIDKGFLEKKSDGNLRFVKDISGTSGSVQTVNIPLVGSVACGIPILAEENIEAMIPVSTDLTRGPHKYFFLRAQGDSMNEVDINDGDLVLIRQQCTAETGDIVVALINNEATIKQFSRSDVAVILLPKSSNTSHKPIVLTTDFEVQGIVVVSIPNSEVLDSGDVA